MIANKCRACSYFYSCLEEGLGKEWNTDDMSDLKCFHILGADSTASQKNLSSARAREEAEE